ncbi:YjcG family protein [Salimicrobium halophilum]|uniref:Putative phosphoesterase SAMN04490247_1989 n=1 Tax=Salimicrobium halophilum TaxID=86666 RepID=A0A1G8TVP0_9BACI|nr:YjcG family protein [Salimicrobium halophilum]SDJ45474.1 2'-5' RNA ligase [Salimicrobium halophilum]
MKYGIAIFPSKKVQDEANSYRKRYDPHYALVPPHITLKYPFESDDEEIEKSIIPALDEIAKNHKPIDIEVKKVGSFKPVENVIYLKIEPNDYLEALSDEMHKGAMEGEREHTFVPHITIAQKLSDDEFSDVYESLRMSKFDLTDRIDRFQLLYQLENESWSVYETFRLKGE